MCCVLEKFRNDGSLFFLKLHLQSRIYHPEKLLLGLEFHNGAVEVDGGGSFQTHGFAFFFLLGDLIHIPSLIEAFLHLDRIESDLFPESGAFRVGDLIPLFSIFQIIHEEAEFPVFSLGQGIESSKCVPFGILVLSQGEILVSRSDLVGLDIFLIEFLSDGFLEKYARRTLVIGKNSELHLAGRSSKDRTFDVLGNLRNDRCTPARDEYKRKKKKGKYFFHMEK